MFLLLSGGSLHSQEKSTSNEFVLWNQCLQKIRLNHRYTASLNAQYRVFTDREKGYHLYFSFGVLRKLNHGFSASLGLTNLNNNQFVDSDFVLVPEIRPFQSISYSSNFLKSNFSWRLMVEERFFKKAEEGHLVEGFHANWRIRNKVLFKHSLSEKIFFLLSSEVMVNAGGIDINIFDQHRGQAMVGYLFDKLSFNLGYMHWFVQTESNVHQNRHTLIIAFAHSI